jgi:hypothetical protein
VAIGAVVTRYSKVDPSVKITEYGAAEFIERAKTNAFQAFVFNTALILLYWVCGGLCEYSCRKEWGWVQATRLRPGGGLRRVYKDIGVFYSAKLFVKKIEVEIPMSPLHITLN